MLFRLLKAMHFAGVHLFCRTVTRRMELPGYRLDDGTVWKPDLNGIMPTYRVHVPRIH